MEIKNQNGITTEKLPETKNLPMKINLESKNE
jgi:hypothetical protein